MSVPSTAPFIADPDLADVIEAAAEKPASDRKELSNIATDLLVALVRLIVSVAARPLNSIIHKAVAARLETERELLVMQIRDGLRADIESNLRIEYDARLAALAATFDEKVSAAVQRERASIVADVRADIQVAPAAPAAASVHYIDRHPTYPFTLLAALIGALIGGFGSWWLTRSFEQTTLVDEAGRNWIATSIAADPTYAVVFIGVSTVLVAAVCAVFGWIADATNNRNR